MYMTHTNPWRLLDRIQADFNQQQLGARDTEEATTASDWAPAVDIIEESTRFLIRADIPGVAPKDIDIHMEDGVLTITGERQSETKEENAGYKRVERVRGSFFRRFSMPDTADAEHISARSEHGVLEVSIPKLERVQHRKIQVEG